MRLKLFAVVAAIAVISAAYFVLRPAIEPKEDVPEPCTGPDCGPAAATAEERLVQRYAPVVYLAESVTDCNQNLGDFRPIPVEVVLGNNSILLRDSSRQEATKIGATAADLYGLGPQFFLDFPGNPRRPGCRFLRDGREFAADQPYVAYARLVTEEGYEELVLQYWLFYYFNQWNNKHEGDWEMIQIVFEAESAQAALAQEPVRIAYSQHSSGELALWDDKRVQREGSRPVLHVAAGSHGNYYTPHVFLGRAEQGAGFGCDDASGPVRLSLEARLLPETISGPDDPYAWITFEGRWGELAGPEFNGPTGPNRKFQWERPLSWEEGLRTSSVRVPSRETLGPNVFQAFCSVVDWGSNLLLPIYLQLPEISMAVVGLLAVGAVVSLTRTRYIPATRRPLRKLRRIGQILLSALTIYTTNSRLFIGIGLLFLPVTLTVSVVHWLVLNVSPVDPIVPMPHANAGQEIIIAFALSGLQFGIAYGLVLSACTAALGAIDRREDSSVIGSFRTVWRRLPALLPPRLFAYAVVAGLAFTVVGIPLAIRQAVRWTFIEQAVLLDGANYREALHISSDAADQDWWWTAASAVGLGFVGLFAAPATGIVLLLAAQSIPLADVSLITSVIHVALVPFVAIAYALVYFNLRARFIERHGEDR